jgi:phosphonopyruvate decarboxylase
LSNENKDAVIISSLGTISYDMKEISHKEKILIKGAMGCVMGVGLGYALSTDKKVIVVIGDGAFLMKAGSIATINRYKPENLQLIILDNGKYESCGGQPTNFQYLYSEEGYSPVKSTVRVCRENGGESKRTQ